MRKVERERTSSVHLRNYNPDTDFQAVKRNLGEGDLYYEGWDGEEKLRKRIQERPDSIVVAVVDNQVVGNVFIVDDFIHIFFA